MATQNEKMQRYRNLDGSSGVVAYATGPDFVRIRFRNQDKVYTYSHDSAGQEHVENLKLLAAAGRGLSTYISRHVHDLYE